MKKSKRKKHHGILSLPPSVGKSGSCRSCGKTTVDLHRVTDIYLCSPCIEDARNHTQCTRCKGRFKKDHPLVSICYPCFEKNEKLTTKEKESMNRWDHIDDVIKVLELAKVDKWSWASKLVASIWMSESI